MKIPGLKAAAVLFLALALFCSPALCRAGEYEKLAAELVNTAKTEGLSRLVIEEFTAQGLAAGRTGAKGNPGPGRMPRRELGRGRAGN